MEFKRCTQVYGEAISNEIFRIIKKADLDITNCHGQGNDGSSNMSSEAVIYFYLYHFIRAGYFEVSADLSSEILTERYSGKQMFWNW